ncbi:MAG: DUF4440 domain-containing protein [Ferruginibacter sp.]
MKRGLIFIAAFLLIMASCVYKNKSVLNKEEERQHMLSADREFSALSKTKGMKAAFLEYIDSNGVLLRPGRLPIMGADAIDYLIQQNDSAFSFSWEPKDGFIAQSGELGYTFGVYTLRETGTDTAAVKSQGTYVSIWKKQSDGKWKYVLDSGNEGLGE